MVSREKGYKIRAKVHGKGGIFFTSRRAWLPLLKLIAVTRTGTSSNYAKYSPENHSSFDFLSCAESHVLVDHLQLSTVL